MERELGICDPACFVWSNELMIMSLAFLLGIILVGNSFSQCLLHLSASATVAGTGDTW